MILLIKQFINLFVHLYNENTKYIKFDLKRFNNNSFQKIFFKASLDIIHLKTILKFLRYLQELWL